MYIARPVKLRFVRRFILTKAGKTCESTQFLTGKPRRTFSMQFSKRKSEFKQKKQENDSYMKRRLEQLEESAMEFGYDKEKMMGLEVPKKSKTSLIDQDPLLKEIHNSLDQKEFELKNQSELAYHRIPSYAGKQSENIALSKPWKGGESAEDLNSILQNEISSKTFKKVLKNKGTLLTPKSSSRSERIQDRLHTAREKSLDYTLAKYDEKQPDKSEEYEKKESNKFREMYKERLLGVQQISFTALNHSIKSLADSKIEEAMSKGAFNNLPRGQAIDNEFNHNAYLDGTEYHLNKMLCNQKVTLPWIEKQGSVHTEIRDFRKRLKDEWLTRVVHSIDDKLKPGAQSLEGKLKIVKRLAENYESLQDKEWETQKRKELKPMLRKLNDSIRGYNLQAPMASQIFYLIDDGELKRARKDASSKIYAAVKQFWCGNDTNGHSAPKNQRNQGTKRDVNEPVANESQGFSIFKFFQ